MKSIQAATYPIHFEQKAYQELSNLIATKNYSSIFILVDENTMEHCYPRCIQHVATNIPIEVIEIESGEVHKNIDTCMGIWNVMTELNADRHSLLITLGGGVITDMGGFVAATYKRGIDFVNIPTTLLSMVDASVGGKTGVDLGVLKNQIGLFANPEIVLIDPEYLQTVTPREIRSGTAEIIKYGLTYDKSLFDEICNHENLNIVNLIPRSIEIKNEVVLQDPKEKSLRKILNFGHTIGHAIESYFLDTDSKENLTHGEAIAIGMICECFISSKLLNFSKEDTDNIKSVIISIYGKAAILKEDFSFIINLLKHDKKNIGGEINFVLLNKIEDFKLDCKVPTELIIQSLEYYNEVI
ncbi:3-dehydroquinate synthase [Tenacibaculum maritimum]|uniref:3-dehydroquinate synthase n=1 Tax=Tenacibaculum maritimum TaxID=107401 RepID=UPI0010A4C378|nr:3-dehydroquinate synthase [Tenacibaculum maritimum]MCD9584332.1 3-dehydroquinate synthase [Tenacibaculum maritimum]MCD9620147.1 3-dehydroquinate synthase [Tenacibaculum maritimum]MCD9626274.1 3-dehydroquinate synthase [Tenacibaculum maritimum]MCD9629240.1 3-dehydroquinate synthase [Tenacibaculum maritimum]MCD9632812.1 3-dehydroquinate synthase [Tenacibaculum maritimum]